MKILKYIVGIGFSSIMLSGCFQTDAKVASENLSKASDMFEIDRRIVFYNGITGEYMLNIEGKCSVENLNNRLAVTCKVADNKFKKHFLGLSDNVTYFVEQLESKKVSTYHYRVIFKPQTILSDVDFIGSSKELKKVITLDTNH